MAEKEQKKFPVFRHLVNKYGHDKLVKQIEGVATKKGIVSEFWKYPGVDEKKIIKILKSPEATFSERFSKTDGVGFVGTCEDIGEATKYPIGFSESQIFDLAAEVKAHYPEWSFDLDEGFHFVENLSFEVERREWETKDTKEKRSKISFTIQIDSEYNQKKVDIKEMIATYNKLAAEGKGVNAADMFGGFTETDKIPDDKIPEES